VIQIRVTEQVPVAYWGRKGFINRRGEVFHATARRPLGKLPRFSGPVGSEGVLSQRFNDMNRMLARIRLKVVRVDVDQRRAWRIQLDNGLRLRLGRRHVLDRLKRFIAVYPVIVARQTGEVEQIDLRYTNGLAVRWRKEKSKQPEKSGAVPGGVG
jgi:cell division protein FtsQ